MHGGTERSDLGCEADRWHRAYCGWTPASFMTLLHSVVSAFKNLAASGGVLPTGSSCSSRSLASIAGRRIRSDMSRLIFSTIAGGVPWGAAAANHETDRNPGATDSEIVGMSGNTRKRWSPATAMILAFSARCSGSDVTIVSNIMSTWPATRSLSAGPAPR